MADELVGGHGHVVATYFDVGTSRRVPWHQRPQAAQLMTETSSPESEIDAIVVGEYERAFTGTQFATLYSRCSRHGIQLWLPETAGPVDLSNRDHRALMSLLATQSQREVLRARHRVLAAMHNRPPSKAATSAADHPTATNSSTPAPTPTPPTPAGADDSNASHPTHEPRPTSPGSSGNAWPGKASPASPDTSMSVACPAHRAPTRTATGTAPAEPGRCARSP